MLFHEAYSSYFNVIAKVLDKAVQGDLSEQDINNIVLEKAFGESILNIPNSLKNGSWKLLNSNMETPLHNAPKMPLTLLQKQWLKALLNDPRIKLFNPSAKGLEDVEPLYEQKSIEYFDRYSDGDNFEDFEYIKNFQTVLTALKQNKKLRMTYTGKKWTEKEFICSPFKLEYSSKDDKFRLKAVAFRKIFTLNLSKMKNCEMTTFEINDDFNKYEEKKQSLVILLNDERKALERVMLNFSHLEKETEKLDDKHYRITLKYDKSDETEILIRILSFGPLLRVSSPDDFIEKLKNRIDKQRNCEV